MQSSGRLFLHEQNPLSLRWAVCEDDGFTIWLYLSVPDKTDPDSDVWVYNTNPGASLKERRIPPPAPAEFCENDFLLADPLAVSWSFVWSADGNAVCLMKDHIALAFVSAAIKPGFCRNLRKAGPWGNPWSRRDFQRLFPGHFEDDRVSQ